MITESFFKDIPALTLETPRLRAKFLPDHGAKFASLVDLATGKELLAQAPGKSYLPLTMDSSFVKSECSAFDDMFPTIDPEGDLYPDHGEVCRVAHTLSLYDDHAETVFRSPLLPYEYKKAYYACADGSIRIDYTIRNLSDKPLRCLWAGHIMFASSENARVETSYNEGDDVAIAFCNNGPYRKDETLPFTADMAQAKAFSENGATYKFYFLKKQPEGFLRFCRPDLGIAVRLTYDPSILPYIGMWINNGTFKGMHTAAPEVCTAPFDAPTQAMEKGYPEPMIEANGVLAFSLTFGMEVLPA